MRARVALLLVLALTAGVYLAAGPRGFVFDDDKVLVKNERLRLGLTRPGFAWAFGEFTENNWYPMTWISHLAAYRAFGLEPAGHQHVNLALHLANTALLALALARMTGAAGRSIFVAALFALHPLHVETVAWVTERCGLLSGFFGLLALLAYVGYVRRPAPLRALGVGLAFTAGLLSKASLVTLPVVFLLLDFWPLGRWHGATRQTAVGLQERLRAGVWLAAEKLPLLALAGAVIVVTFLAQVRGGAVVGLRDLPLGMRFTNAVVVAVGYLGKTFWPQGLAVYYPPPLHPWPAWQVGLCTLALVAVTALCLQRLRSAPFLAAGWLWFLVGFLPVIGLVKTGEQVMADRYTYLPLTGIFVAVAWGVAACARRFPLPRLLVPAGALGAVAAAALLTAGQLRFWRNDATLFARAVAVTENNFIAHYQLGWIAAMDGRRADAIAHFEETVRIDPSMAAAQYGLGVLLALDGRVEGAEARYRAALAINPKHAEAHNNLGELLFARGSIVEAADEIRAALRVAPGDGLAHFNLGRILERLGDPAGAMASYRKAQRLLPDFGPARDRASALEGAGQP